MSDSRPKRAETKVERFDYSDRKETETKKVETKGTGTLLGDIPVVSHFMSKISSDHGLLVSFHRLLHGTPGKASVRKANIRKFSGWGDDVSA